MIDVNEIEIYEDDVPSDPSIEAERRAEIQATPRDSEELRERLDNSNNASPADSGGDIDAQWEEVETTGSEAVFGDNPTPDQSDVEANAHAMGIDFQDNEPLDFTEKLEKRDRDRWELQETSKADDETI